MKNYLMPLGALFLFLFLQGVLAFVVLIVFAFTSSDVLAAMSAGDSDAIAASFAQLGTNPNVMSLSLIASSVLTCIVMIWPLKMFDYKREFTPAGIGIGLSCAAVVGSVFGIFFTDLFSELLDLPNIIEAQLDGMSSTVLGALAISLFGPLAEEFVFRGAIMGYMLRNGVAPRIVILFSAFLFGVIHINPAQIPFAMIVGVILGIIYYRTRNIILTSIVHILNNSLATLLSNVVSDDFVLTDALGDSPISSVIVAMICLFACYMFLSYFWKHTQEDVVSVEETVILE